MTFWEILLIALFCAILIRYGIVVVILAIPLIIVFSWAIHLVYYNMFGIY